MEIQERITEKLTKFCVDNGITCFRTIQHLTIAANLGASAVYEKQAEEEKEEFINPSCFDMPDLSRAG